MIDQSDAQHMLDTARRLLRDELLPALPADKRHAALMIANAMAIAARRMTVPVASASEELASLETLLSLPASPPGTDAATLHQRLVSANRLLCARLREGLADDGAMRAPCLAHLTELARRQLAVSNPKYLAGRDPGAPA